MPDDAPPPPRATVHAAQIFCESCGRETPHRILRLLPGSGPHVQGTARCRECRLTHPFTTPAPPAPADVEAIVSDGPLSRTVRVALPPGTELRVGDVVPTADGPITVRRIETEGPRRGGPVAADRVRTLWAVRGAGRSLPVSIIEGRRTRSIRMPAPPDRAIEIGDQLVVEGVTLEVVGLRARGHTWRRPGDRFAADEIARVYTRRYANPPAGRSDWRTLRETPRSAASSTSRSGRVRSSSGASRT